MKELTFQITGPLVKENEEMVLIDNGDGTATWYHKAMIEHRHHSPFTNHLTFDCTKHAAVRSVRLK